MIFILKYLLLSRANKLLFLKTQAIRYKIIKKAKLLWINCNYQRLLLVRLDK
jgi:hypothetical protein